MYEVQLVREYKSNQSYQHNLFLSLHCHTRQFHEESACLNTAHALLRLMITGAVVQVSTQWEVMDKIITVANLFY